MLVTKKSKLRKRGRNRVSWLFLGCLPEVVFNYSVSELVEFGKVKGGL
jgi:hypothetical protein